jgi:hypothetical protein
MSLMGVSSAAAATLYSNGFESNTVDWTADVTRVSSGTNGIPAASGGFYGESHNGSSSHWGGYNYGAGNVATAFQEYSTSLDIYLDVDGGSANDTRFDFDSAINNAAGTFLRDFVFNAGFYDSGDATGPGAGTNRFVISASNNSQPGSAYAKNPARDPIAISTTGWYTFENHFYDNAGVLAVDLNIYDSSHTAVHSWTLSNPVDLIAGVGGNRYAWFDYSQFSTLAIDNASLVTAAPSAVPLPATAWMGLALIGGVGGLGGIKRLRRPVA